VSDDVTDEWSFDELQTADWAAPGTAHAVHSGTFTDHPRETGDEMDPSSSERRGLFHLRRHKHATEGIEVSEPGRTPVENLADYVAAQGLEVPEELRPHPVEETPTGEIPAVEAEPTPAPAVAAELPAAPADDLWSEPDSDDEAAAAHATSRSRGLRRRRGSAASEQFDGPVDLEHEATGTMEPAEEPAPAASAESTDRPGHEEQAVSEESTTNERTEDHVWTAAELAAEGWTTADLKGAGWTDAHLESIGWPLESDEPKAEEAKAEEPAPAEPEAAVEEPATAEGLAPAEDVKAEEPEAKADEAEAPADESATDESAADEADKAEEVPAAVEPEPEPEPAPKRRGRAKRKVEQPAEEVAPVEAEAAAEAHDEPTLPGLEATGAHAEPEIHSVESTSDDVAAEVAATDEGMPEVEDHAAHAPSVEAAPVDESPAEEAPAEEAPAAEPEPEPVAAAEPEPEPAPAAEPEPAPAAVEPEPTPEPEPAPVTAAPVAAPAAVTVSDLTPEEIERALELGESLSEILARKNASLPAAAAAPHMGAVSPATASVATGLAPAGAEPSPESSTSGTGGGDRGGDDSDDPDPAVATVEPPVVELAPAPEPIIEPVAEPVAAPESVFEPAHTPEEVPQMEPELETWDEAPTSVIPKVVAPPTYAPEEPTPVTSTSATRAAANMIASEAATETGAEDVERVEYRPGNGRRYLFGAAFIAAAVLSVVAVFWAIQNPGIAPSVTAGCLVVLTGALWWSLMAWSPRIIAIGHGVLEFSQGGHVERFNLLDPDTNIAVGPDPASRTWRAEVIRANGTKVIVRPDDVRPQQFSALIAKYREEAEASRR
jgi:hypothetical protein